MNSLNLITMLALFATILITTTVNRKFLTYKGVQTLLIFNNLLLLIYCTYYWNTYIVNYATESCVFKLNPNTWYNVSYELNFKITSLSFLFIFLVNIIGFATNIYILNYFKFEERNEEFILLINWFILSMIILVSSNNFFTIILGWELIGITSFLLINFWKFKITTLSCSFKAFAFNKFSDLFLMLALCSLWNAYKVDNIDTLLNVISFNKTNNSGTLMFAAVCLLVCSSIKSAQIFGHLWLPDSMEAPVPASALIHSATLVSAGIYLLLKFQLIFMLTGLMSTIFFLGSITACYGGIVAASQSDVKKLLAYSTISHCGFIYVSIALNNFLLSIVYLYLHGLFKAVTFFCVGSLIKYNNTQDMRYMGANKSQIFNTTALIISTINLGGLPFTFGYLYKQMFLVNLVICNYNFLGYGFCILGMLSSVVYVYKLIYYSCFDFQKGSLQTLILLMQNHKNVKEAFWSQFTVAKLIAFCVIHVYALCFFLIVKLYISKLYIFTTHSSEVLVNDLKFLASYIYLKKHLISIYYCLFTITIIVLVINSWRTNYFYMQKISIIQNILSFTMGWTIVNFIFKYLLIYLL